MTNLWKTLTLAAIFGLGFSFSTTYASQTDENQDQDKQEKKQDEDEQDQDEMSLQDRMQEAQQSAIGGDLEEAIELLGDVHKDFPDELGVTLTYLSATQQYASQLSNNERVDGNEYYYKSAKVAREIMDNEDLTDQMKSLIATCIYNEACSLGVDGEKEKAMKVLKEAFDYGFDKYELAREDSDFGDLLETDEYKKLVDDAEKAKSTGMLDAIMSDIAKFESFDFDFEIDTLDADELTLESLRGKMVIVDLWSTASPASRGETKSLVKLKSEHKDKLEIVGMAFERGDDDEAYDAVERYIKRNDINYPCSLGDEDIRDQLPDFEEYPTKVFIDAEGKVRFVKAGVSTYEELEAIVSKLSGNDE